MISSIRIGRVLAVASIAALALAGCSNDDDSSSSAASSSSTSSSSASSSSAARTSSASAASSSAQQTEGECTYRTESARQAAKSVEPPPADVDPALPATATITTSQGPIGLTLDPAKSPCTVNSFVSLAEQGYFDGTSCHRLTTSAGLQVLQCGDPTGTGAGGPGYSFADEYPVGESTSSTLYTRGTLAMANAGPNTNGSQFFLVYGDSQLTPDYTIFGTIDEAGLATIDSVVAGGVEPGSRGPDDGTPVTPVEIQSVTVG